MISLRHFFLNMKLRNPFDLKNQPNCKNITYILKCSYGCYPTISLYIYIYTLFYTYIHHQTSNSRFLISSYVCCFFVARTPSEPEGSQPAEVVEVLFSGDFWIGCSHGNRLNKQLIYWCIRSGMREFSIITIINDNPSNPHSHPFPTFSTSTTKVLVFAIPNMAWLLLFWGIISHGFFSKKTGIFRAFLFAVVWVISRRWDDDDDDDHRWQTSCLTMEDDQNTLGISIRIMENVPPTGMGKLSQASVLEPCEQPHSTQHDVGRWFNIYQCLCPLVQLKSVLASLHALMNQALPIEYSVDDM